MPNRNNENRDKGSMSVSDAGKLGGQATKREMAGTGFYQKIGKMGGGRVRELIKRGKESEGYEEEQY